MQSIVACIKQHAENNSNNIALVVGKYEITYAELWARILTASKWYLSQNTCPGDRILIVARTRDPFFVVAYFAAQLVRAVPVPVDPRVTEKEIYTLQSNIDARIAFNKKVLDKFNNYSKEYLSTQFNVEDNQFPNPNDIAEIIFTTGSTGKPKGVMLSHKNIFASAKLIHNFVGNTKSDIEVVTVPLTHSFGLGRLRAVMLVGGTIVLIPGLTFPQLIIDAIDKFGATGLVCVPTGIALLMSRYAETLSTYSSQLKYMEMGSAPMPIEQKRELCKLLPNTRLCMHYGQTEASRSTFLEFHADYENLDAIGKSSPGVEVKIIDEFGKQADNLEQGFISVKSDTVMQCYFNNNDLTNKVLDVNTGWLNTRDIGYKDKDDYFYLVGRSDDVINCGGEKIYPNEIETLANSYTDITESACVAEKHDVLGEVPVLYIVAETNLLDLDLASQFIKNKLDNRIKYINLKLIDKLPKTESGKLLRKELKKL